MFMSAGLGWSILPAPLPTLQLHTRELRRDHLPRQGFQFDQNKKYIHV